MDASGGHGPCLVTDVKVGWPSNPGLFAQTLVCTEVIFWLVMEHGAPPASPLLL